MRFFLIVFYSIFLLSLGTNAQVYRTSWDDSTQRQGWMQYQLGTTATTQWAYTPVAVLMGEVLVHTAPNTPLAVVTDNWMVSPPFNFTAGGSIDSLIFNLSGVGVPNSIDTLGIYLLNGAQDPAQASWTLLKQFDSADYAMNGGTYQNLPPINIPNTLGSAYIAFRYRTSNGQFDALFDALQITAKHPNRMNQKSKTSGIRVCPNPTNGICILEFKKGIDNDLSIQLVDLMGSTYAIELINDKIDLSAFPKGTYLLKMTDMGSNSFYEKIILR